MSKRKTIDQKNKRELIKNFDSVYSEYIRLYNADDNGYCECVTCGKILFWKNIHNGHFISRKNETTRYSEINCNTYGNGKWLEYEARLIEMYGQEKIEDLKKVARIGGGYTKDQLKEMIEVYKNRVKKLKTEKCL